MILIESSYTVCVSRKHSAICPFDKSVAFKVHPLLIESSGGSGSHQISCLLRKIGIRIQHEQVDKHGSVVRKLSQYSGFVLNIKIRLGNMLSIMSY